MTRWKLPSPTWPRMGTGSSVWAMSLAVAAMQSASRGNGHADVEGHAAAPRRSCRQAKYASWRACQSRLRSSAGGPGEIEAALVAGDGLHCTGLFLDARRAAVEFEKSVGATARLVLL